MFSKTHATVFRLGVLEKIKLKICFTVN